MFHQHERVFVPYLPYPLCTCDFMYSNGQTIHHAMVAATPEIRNGPRIGRAKYSGKLRRPVSTKMKYDVIRPSVLTQVTPKPWRKQTTQFQNTYLYIHSVHDKVSLTYIAFLFYKNIPEFKDLRKRIHECMYVV